MLNIFTGILLGMIFMFTAKAQQARNPVIFADVPDQSVIRVGNNYYMSSTTMHMSPGVPIMKSTDLVNWQLVRYAYDTLADMDDLNLLNGRTAYGKGTWASCIRYHKGRYYISSFAQTTGKTYIFSTDNIETGKWQSVSFRPAYHDHSLFFDDDGKVYLVYGTGNLKIVTLKDDLSGIEPGSEKVLIENASAPAGDNIGLRAEGSQLFRINGKYFLLNITWPRGGMRTVVIHRADKLNGPYEGRLALQDLGVAQGGLIDKPDGTWFAYLFRDYGAVGRIPYLVPVSWVDGWPVFGINGKVPEQLGLPASNGLIPGIVASDEFSRNNKDRALPLVWQWNHNPDNRFWSVSKRKGYLRLTTGRLDSSFVKARNTLTQRTFGPVSSATTRIDVSNMKDGDLAGLGLLQEHYGLAGVRITDNKKQLVMINAGGKEPVVAATIPLDQKFVFLRASCDFEGKKDEANFFYSLDGTTWTPIGTTLKMSYTLSHFMGYRFALFNYATIQTGGYADFDYYHISNQLNENNEKTKTGSTRSVTNKNLNQ
ncbi:MAG: glycoside hydrolase 43 family protein [Chitinophagaceae bacterium]